MTMLPSFEIKNFRTFDHLVIDKFAQINLITGMNGVGKSSLLESINFYVNGCNATYLRKLGKDINNDEIIHNIFHNYTFVTPQPITISIGVNNDDKIEINSDSITNEDGNLLHLNFKIKRTKNGKEYDEPQQTFLHNLVSDNGFDKSEKNYFISSEGLTDSEKILLWNKVELRPIEKEIKSAVQLLNNKIVDIRPMLLDKGKQKTHTFRVMLDKIERPVLLKSLGEGTQKQFEYILTLFTLEDGTLLIDEIENGLHYSIQPDVWKLIFTLAKRLNVQVFATTHSWDCIDAFQKASSKHEDVDCELIRLSKVNDKFRSTIFEKSELEIITQENIEVR